MLLRVLCFRTDAAGVDCVRSDHTNVDPRRVARLFVGAGEAAASAGRLRRTSVSHGPIPRRVLDRWSVCSASVAYCTWATETGPDRWRGDLYMFLMVVCVRVMMVLSGRTT